MGPLRNIVYNYVLMTALISWFSAQVLKTIIYFIVNRKFDAQRLVGAGGMPSSHSALVCATAIAVARKVGLGSVEFAIAFILAMIVMYDATGVRRAAGEHAKELNKMRKYIDEDEEDSEPLKEFLGHTPFEVLGGALLGMITALLVPVS